jgi:hypothetical protein
MEILYRKFNATDGYTTIEHNNLDRSKGLFKISMANPRIPISDIIKNFESNQKIQTSVGTVEEEVKLEVEPEVDTKVDTKEQVTNNCSAEISSTLLSKAQVRKYIQESRDTLKSLGHEEMYPETLFSDLDFEGELAPNCTNEWLIGNQNYYLYYICTSNASWLPFLKKEVLYTVVYGIKVIPVVPIVPIVPEVNVLKG